MKKVRVHFITLRQLGYRFTWTTFIFHNWGGTVEKASEPDSSAGLSDDADSDNENLSGFRPPRKSVTDVFEASRATSSRDHISRKIATIGGNIKVISRRVSNAVDAKRMARKRVKRILEPVKPEDYLMILKEEGRLVGRTVLRKHYFFQCGKMLLLK